MTARLGFHSWDDVALVIEFAARDGHHVPGTPEEWRHGWDPLTEGAAKSHGGGKVPKGWKAPPESERLTGDEAFAHARSKAGGDRFTDEEKRRVAHYTLNSDLVNGSLRDGSYLRRPLQAEKISAVDAAIAKTEPLDHDIEAYRGIPRSVRLVPGHEYTDPAFVSTSASREQAAKWATDDPDYAAQAGRVVAVRIPRGSRALPTIDAVTHPVQDQEREQELLLPRGTRFRVTDDGNLEVAGQPS